MTFTIIGLLIVFALMGAPLFTVIIAAAMYGFHLSEIDLSVMAIELYRIADTPILLALPLFTFAGYLLGESNTSQRLVTLTQAFLGWIPGGLAIVAFVVCALFTAFTGASGVTIVAMGALLYPALTQAGYTDHFSLGLVTTSGSLGLLLPPSLPLILYGIIAQQMSGGEQVSIENLFLAGLFPALLMIVMLSIWSVWANRGNQVPLTRFSVKNCFSALKAAGWEVPLPLFVFFGIYSGYFAVSEAAAVTAMYVLVVEVLIYREIALKKLPGIIRESMVMVGGILLILGVSLALTNYLIDAEAPMKLFKFCETFVASKLVFLILLNIFLLILGAMLDIFSAIIIMVPLMLPVALKYGIHPVHLGIIFLANMQIGYFTPPVGMNLFIAGYRFKKPIDEIYRATIPFMLVLLLSVLIITYWPQLSLFLI
ncbi:TRAP transporter large permease [Desulfobacter hydrogenophilus]|uniref:TRAP transporter large permease n=1 Tax=Desulfobacter hydrogenophilus TaxID=2291 RepID=A0A328FEB1_9BACT|nr:TRAP transporter large permease subunit [Desulfobacter hydrogenophilus]NDY70986.1 TRAP transporter large permease subunit [Desulfobacter hydrogenophilus]QBH12774.1 TRAP transporter large permease subunit [Desulfobacter hydrogenophilus]RAM03011.1 TRAP transporter large permease [Desulfobacter hydrogenophilus]